MLRKLAFFHASGGMIRVKVGLFCSHLWGRQILYHFLPSQVVKTGGYAKKAALVNLTFSIFCGLPYLFLRNQHCLHISFFVWKPGVRNPDLCFSLSRRDETRRYPFSESKVPNFGPLLFASLGSSGKIFRLCSESKGPNFGPLLYAPLK